MVWDVLRLSSILVLMVLSKLIKNMKCFNNLHTHVSKSAHCATLAIWSNHFISLNHSIMFIRTKYFWLTRCYLSSFDGLVMYHIQPQSRNIRYLIRTKKLTRSEKISRWANLKLQGAGEEILTQVKIYNLERPMSLLQYGRMISASQLLIVINDQRK